MNNDNIVKIGTALKWRNTFDITKKYYQENVVTACGCVFRCKVLQAQGKSPVRATDEQGHIVYTNTDVWDVLVDMAYYYNFAVDTKKLTQETFDYVKKLDEAFQKQQKEIQALQEDNSDQWNHIDVIEQVNDEQFRELDSILDTISCFSEGIWIDTLLWSNETIWDNNKYAITDDLQNQIDVLNDNHRKDIEDLTDKHDREISALAAHVVYQEKIQGGINDYLQDQIYDLNNSISCFGTGVWENDLHWSEITLWNNNKFAITDALAEDIQATKDDHRKDVDAINQHLDANDNAHHLVNQHLDKHDREIEKLQDLINEHDRQITDLIDTLSCFSAGQWDNGLKWSNVAVWENSNLMCDTFEDIYRQISNHYSAIDDLRKQIQQVKTDAENTLNSINNTFNNFRKEHESFRLEHQAFSNEHNSFRIEHKEFNENLNSLDSLCEEQQREIDALLYRISIITNGVWDNTLLWINDSEWINTDFNGSCHCPVDTEERLDELQEGLTDLIQRVSVNEQAISECQTDIAKVADRVESNTLDIAHNANEIESIKQNAIKEHRDVAYQLRAIGREQKIQDENVAKIGNHFNCYADGIWGDLFIWDNKSIWANKSGVITDALEDIHTNIRSTKQKLNDANEDIMMNLSLIQTNHRLIQTNTEAIQENESAIQDIQSKLDTAVEEIHNNALTEHRSVAYQLRAIGREQVAQDENIVKLGEHFGCFVNGQWGDLFLWDNNHLWHNNVGVITEAISDINYEIEDIHSDISDIQEQIENHVTDNENTIDTICAQSSIFDQGKWANPFFWNDSDLWFNTPDSLSVVESEMIKHDDRITALEAQFALFAQQFSMQQTIIEQQQQQIETLMDCFTVLNVGKWQNLLLWDNISKWSNDLITEASTNGGIASVAVKSYDPETATVSI